MSNNPAKRILDPALKYSDLEVNPDNSLVPPTAPVKVIIPPAELVPAVTVNERAVPSLLTVLSKNMLSLDVPAVSVLFPPDNTTGPLYLWSLVVVISFDKIIVWEFPDFPMVRSVNVPVIFVVEIAEPTFGLQRVDGEIICLLFSS